MDYNLKYKWIGFILILFWGCCDGITQQILFHYWDFEEVWGFDPIFWNPEISWANKWAWNEYGQMIGEKFPLSSTVLVFLTDGYHLLRTLVSWFSLIGIILIVRSSQKFYQYFIDLILIFLIRGIGFAMLYNWIPKLLN